MGILMSGTGFFLTSEKISFLFPFFLVKSISGNRTVEEYKKGHVSAGKIINIPYMFNTPEGLSLVSNSSKHFLFPFEETNEKNFVLGFR